MGNWNRTYRALAVATLVASAPVTSAPGAGAAGIFGANPLADESTVALAQPVDGSRWNLVVVQRLQGSTGCWRRQDDGLVSLEPEALSNDAVCSRLQSSSGYSLRAAGQDVGMPWRLRVEPVGNRLELQAFSPSQNTPITIATAPLVNGGTGTGSGVALPAFSLNPGWSFQQRSYEGRLLSHVYLSSQAPLTTLQSDRLSQERQPNTPPPLAAAGQVIALQVVPFRGDSDLTAANP